MTVEDVTNENQHVLLFDDICERLGRTPNRILEYNVVCAAVKSFLSKTDNHCMNKIIFEKPTFCGSYISTLKDFRLILARKKKAEACCIGFWKRKFNFDITSEVWTVASTSTKETRLRLLHWKVLHNIYATNILLSKMKVKDNNKCSYCKNVVDFIEHYFYECPVVKRFWLFIEQYIFMQSEISVKLDVEIILFGFFDKEISKSVKQKINHILLVAKMCISIYKKTVRPPPLEVLFERNARFRNLPNK